MFVPMGLRVSAKMSQVIEISEQLPSSSKREAMTHRQLKLQAIQDTVFLKRTVARIGCLGSHIPVVTTSLTGGSQLQFHCSKG